MAWFEDVDGTIYPIDVIERITPSREIKNGERSRFVNSVYLKGGMTAEVYSAEVKRITRLKAAFISAAPGTFVVYADGTDDTALKRPVLAWCITHDEGVLPVTHDGINDDVDQEMFVEHPSGDVTSYENHWENIDAYIRHQRAVASKNA